MSILAFMALAQAAAAAPVPGYVPPVTSTPVPNYADDTRGVFVPSHDQHRLMTESEQQTYGQYPVAQGRSDFARQMQLDAVDETDRALNRIANDQGLLQNPRAPQQMAQNAPNAQWVPPGSRSAVPYTAQPSLADGMAGQMRPVPMNSMAGAPMTQAAPAATTEDGGVEMVVGQPNARAVDFSNTPVRLREDRITIRRTLQRMMDQVGAGDWQVMWDMNEQNTTLPDMEISVFTEEPFTNVLNALLARVQTRSGQPLRVIRYDNTKRIVITDREGGHRLARNNVSPYGVGADQEAMVTEQVLKEAVVSLHYDEIPLVDALENAVSQAGRGQWRLRVYAGLDQVLKPAHIEEPFSIAMERLLRLFNLKYEIFPGGKLVVVTQTTRMGFEGVGIR